MATTENCEVALSPIALTGASVMLCSPAVAALRGLLLVDLVVGICAATILSDDVDGQVDATDAASTVVNAFYQATLFFFPRSNFQTIYGIVLLSTRSMACGLLRYAASRVADKSASIVTQPIQPVLVFSSNSQTTAPGSGFVAAPGIGGAGSAVAALEEKNRFAIAVAARCFK